MWIMVALLTVKREKREQIFLRGMVNTLQEADETAAAALGEIMIYEYVTE